MTDAATPTQSGTDVATLLDHGPWGAYQKWVVGLIALAIVFDGFDNQVLGFSLPLLTKEWGVGREVFAPVFALGFVGMVIGTIIGGWMGDRFGRRAGLIVSVIVFAIATAAAALADGVQTLTIFRFLAGVGLGGAMPCATTLLAEFSPTRKRSLAVTLGIVCIPLGGVVGGLIAAQVLPTIGWRVLFGIAGLAPLAVALILMMFLPESPRYLLRRGRQEAALKVLKRINPRAELTLPLWDSTAAKTVERGSVAALFSPAFRGDTLALWTAFFFCLLATYLVANWAPTFLVGEGFNVGQSSQALAIFNVGGVIGALMAARWMEIGGSRQSLGWLAALAVSGAVALMFVPLGGDNQQVTYAVLFIEGAFINSVQIGLYALAAHAYPVAIRSSGVGTTAGLGRAGAIASAFAGVVVLAGGAQSYFGAIAGAMAVTLAALTLVKRHVPSRGKAAKAVAAT